MSKNNGSPHFPRKEKFADFAGRTRTFTVTLNELPWGYGVHATEDAKGNDGYQFRAFSSLDAFHALGSLRTKIRKLLSIRHLVKERGRWSFAHDRVRGRVAYGGVVVDGIFLTFQKFARLVQTHEEFQFDLKIVDSS